MKFNKKLLYILLAVVLFFGVYPVIAKDTVELAVDINMDRAVIGGIQNGTANYLTVDNKWDLGMFRDGKFVSTDIADETFFPKKAFLAQSISRLWITPDYSPKATAYIDDYNVIDGAYTLNFWFKASGWFTDGTIPLYTVRNESDTAITHMLYGNCRNNNLTFMRAFKNGSGEYAINSWTVKVPEDISGAEDSGKNTTTRFAGKWFNFTVSYDPDSSEAPLILVNGHKFEVTGSTITAGEGYSPSSYSKDDCTIYFGEGYKGVSPTGNNNQWCNSGSYWGDIKFYKGVMSYENCLAEYEKAKQSYAGYVYKLSIEKDGVAYTKATLGTLKEGNFIFKIPVDSTIKTDTVTAETFKIVNTETNETATDFVISNENGTISLTNGFFEKGNYKVVITTDVLDSDGAKLRDFDYELPFEVEINNTLRNEVVGRINSIYAETSYTADDFMEKVLDENKYLKLDVSDGSDYSKLINKSKVFLYMKKTNYSSFEEIQQEFLNQVTLQKARDENDAVSELNDALRNNSATDAENILFAKYQPIFSLDLSEYNSIVNKQNVVEFMFGEEFLTPDDVDECFYECVEKAKEADKKEAVEKFNQAVVDSDIAALKTIVFVTYNDCFSLDKVKYDTLSRKDDVFRMFDNTVKTFSDIQKAFYDNVDKQHCIETEENFLSEATTITEETFNDFITKYDDITEVDILNEDYVRYKTEVITDIKDSSYTSVEKFDKKFYQFVALNVLNNLEKGQRDEIKRVLDSYGKYLDLPQEYTNLSDKTEVYKGLDGSTFATVELLSSAIKTVVSTPDIPQVPSVPSVTPSGNTGSGGSSSTTIRGNTVSVSKKVVQGASDIPATVPQAGFSDIDNIEWAKKEIDYLYDNGIINGKSEGIFAPGDFITRAEASKIMALAFEIDSNGKNPFSDVKKSDWCYKYIISLSDAGIIKGIDEVSFGYNKPLSREDFSVVLYRVAVYKNINIKKNAEEKFDDNDEISDYAQEAVYALKAAEIINGVGDNLFAPKKSLTRAEACKMIYGLMMKED